MKTIKTFEAFNDWFGTHPDPNTNKPDKNEPQPVKNSSEENIEWEDTFQEEEVYEDDDFFEKINDKVKNRINFENIKKMKSGMDGHIFAFQYNFERFYLEIYSRGVLYYVRRERTKDDEYKRVELKVNPNKVIELFNYMQERIDIYEKAEDRSDMEFFQKELSERKRFRK